MKTTVLLLLSLFSQIALSDTGIPTTQIKVDQAGYPPGAVKKALVVTPTEASEFVVKRSPGSSLTMSVLPAARQHGLLRVQRMVH